MTHPLHQHTDWTGMSNAAIARQHGLTRKEVADFRRNHRKPAGPRSPGSGLWKRGQPTRRKYTKREKAARLDAVWALLWPEDPVNAAGRDEVEAIKRITYYSNQTH